MRMEGFSSHSWEAMGVPFCATCLVCAMPPTFRSPTQRGQK
jgi:hypothetical protein